MECCSLRWKRTWKSQFHREILIHLEKFIDQNEWRQILLTFRGFPTIFHLNHAALSCNKSAQFHCGQQFSHSPDCRQQTFQQLVLLVGCLELLTIFFKRLVHWRSHQSYILILSSGREDNYLINLYIANENWFVRANIYVTIIRTKNACVFITGSIYSNRDLTVFNFVVNPLKTESWIIVACLNSVFIPLSKHAPSRFLKPVSQSRKLLCTYCLVHTDYIDMIV
jgi:hypothetical protein